MVMVRCCFNRRFILLLVLFGSFYYERLEQLESCGRKKGLAIYDGGSTFWYLHSIGSYILAVGYHCWSLKTDKIGNCCKFG